MYHERYPQEETPKAPVTHRSLLSRCQHIYTYTYAVINGFHGCPPTSDTACATHCMHALDQALGARVGWLRAQHHVSRSMSSYGVYA
jgi:hypothetical protein